MQTPSQQYRRSPRSMPAALTPIEYGNSDEVSIVGWNGFTIFKGYKLRLSSALHRLPVAFRADYAHDGCFDVYLSHHKFMRLDLAALTASS